MLTLHNSTLLSQTLSLILGLGCCNLSLYSSSIYCLTQNSASNIINTWLLLFIYGAASLWFLADITSTLESKTIESQIEKKADWSILTLQSIWDTFLEWSIVWMSLSINIFFEHYSNTKTLSQSSNSSLIPVFSWIIMHVFIDIVIVILLGKILVMLINQEPNCLSFPEILRQKSPISSLIRACTYLGVFFFLLSCILSTTGIQAVLTGKVTIL